jgi:ABC-2 type transport system ATP-binding protein
MISVKNLTKKFESKIAVNDISYTIKEGEIVGFLGPNGAGKTTTMRLLLGYLIPTTGSISVNNLDPQKNRIALLNQAGYLPENNPLYSEMKVSEYLNFIAGIKNSKDIDEIINKVGLTDVMGDKIEELSRGFKQRVGLAAALLDDPSVLILDEPTTGLDPLEQEKIRELIKKISKHKTIIFSTHILSEAEDIATKLIIINQGKIVYDGVKPKGKGGVERLFKKLIK